MVVCVVTFSVWKSPEICVHVENTFCHFILACHGTFALVWGYILNYSVLFSRVSLEPCLLPLNLWTHSNIVNHGSPFVSMNCLVLLLYENLKPVLLYHHLGHILECIYVKSPLSYKLQSIMLYENRYFTYPCITLPFYPTVELSFNSWYHACWNTLLHLHAFKICCMWLNLVFPTLVSHRKFGVGMCVTIYLSCWVNIHWVLPNSPSISLVLFHCVDIYLSLIHSNWGFPILMIYVYSGLKFPVFLPVLCILHMHEIFITLHTTRSGVVCHLNLSLYVVMLL